MPKTLSREHRATFQFQPSAPQSHLSSAPSLSHTADLVFEEGPDVLVAVNVQLGSALVGEVLLDAGTELGRVHEQVGRVRQHGAVGEEHRVVDDVAAAQVQQVCGRQV